MSVLVFIDLKDGAVKKASYEAAYYGHKVAATTGGEAIGVALGSADAGELEALGQYGLSSVVHVNDTTFDQFDSGAFTKAIAEVADQKGAQTVVLAFNQNGKALGARLSVRLEAGYVPGANGLPTDDMHVSKGVYSGKAVATFSFNTEKKVIAVTANSIGVEKGEGSASVETADVSVGADDVKTTVKGVDTVDGEVPLTEAEIVVSAGRGLKGPENWGMIDELAKVLGAATACSRPVADVGWRPHHEHVGQTGVTVRPNLYIAIGISGAIQHLAGINQSKNIVVINTDEEAPFWKAADYGIVGDAFDVVPQLTEAIRKHKEAND